jgi:hypothetical protein
MDQRPAQRVLLLSNIFRVNVPFNVGGKAAGQRSRVHDRSQKSCRSV